MTPMARLRQVGKAKSAKNMLNARRLHLLQALDPHLRRAPQGWQAGMAGIVPAFAIALPLGPGFVTFGEAAVFIGRQANRRPRRAGRTQNARGKIFQAHRIVQGLFHGGSHIDTLRHGRLEMGVGIAVGLHLVSPQLQHLGGLAHDVGWPAQDRLDVPTGSPLDRFRTGADGDIEGRMGLLQRFGDDPEVIDLRICAVGGGSFPYSPRRGGSFP